MTTKNLRDFIGYLESKGDLCRIQEPVSRDLEITEIADRTVKAGGPALLFENVYGYSTPILINLYGTHQRTAWALGVDHVEELSERVENLLGLVQNPPQGIVEKFRALSKVASITRSQPKTINKAPCQEIVIEGEDADLNIIPVLKCWPMDAGRFITLPLVISHDPESGQRNVGIYRMQVYDSKTAGLHWQTHKVGANHYRKGIEKSIEQMEVAIAIGADPTTIWSGALPLPPDMDEIAVAGFVREKSVEMVKCKTIDIQVPAESEYILEGYVNLGELRTEGPFGDHTGYYSPPDEYPVFHLKAITHRKSPIYPTTIVGRPPTEDFFMGNAAVRLLFPAMKMTMPEIIDINMPAEGTFHNLAIVSIKKEYPGHARKVMHAIWGLGLLSLTKCIIIVDHLVDVQNLSEVAWRVTNNLNPASDVVFTDGPIDDLDHSSPTAHYGSKMGIDATAKLGEVGRSREWPPDIVMSDSIREIVDEKWSKFGI